MPVASALTLSAEKRVKHLPVVDADGELVGIVGRTEVMRALIATTIGVVRRRGQVIEDPVCASRCLEISRRSRDLGHYRLPDTRRLAFLPDVL